MRERIKWIDVAKFFGILSIYIGHFGAAAGNAYEFVFAFHVPLFFFLSGCTESLSSEKSFGKYVWKKVKTILLPFFMFVVLSIVLFTSMYQGFTLMDALINLYWGIVKGAIRNQFFAEPLWFLSCSFMVAILFRVLKTFMNKYWLWGLSVVIYGVVAYLGLQRDAQLPYNIENALYYFVFFMTGYVAFPQICKLFTLDTPVKKAIFGCSGLAALIYSVTIYYHVEPLEALIDIKIGAILVAYTQAMIVTWLICVMSRLLENGKLLREIGENTLYLCGNEYIMKTIIPYVVGIVGLTINVDGLVKVYCYALVLLVIGAKWMAPYERKAVMAMQKGLDAFADFAAAKRAGKKVPAQEG